MNRRSFLKRAGALLAISYVNPLSLSETLQGGVVTGSSGNYLVSPDTIAKEALTMMENNLVFNLNYFSEKVIKPAAQALSDTIDKDLGKQIKFRRF